MSHIDLLPQKISDDAIRLTVGNYYSWTRGDNIYWSGKYTGLDTRNEKYLFDNTTRDYPQPNCKLGPTGQSKDVIYNLILL